MRKLTRFKQDELYSSPSDTVGLYLVVTKLDKTEYVFDAEFLKLIRYALTTFCTSEMSADQLALFLAYIDAFNGVAPFTAVTSALDEELVNITMSVEYASASSCGNAELFSFPLYGVDINL